MKLTVKKIKRQDTYWEKIFATCVCDKGLESKIYKLNNTTPKNPVKKKKKRRFELTLYQRRDSCVNNHTEMQIEATNTPTGMDFKNNKKDKFCQGCEASRTPAHAWGKHQ